MVGPRRAGWRSSGMPLVLLGAQVLRIGVDNLPPATLALLVGNVAVHVAELVLPQLALLLPDLREVCLQPAAMLAGRGSLQRLLLAHFYHLNDWHLYYNMSSLLWKGWLGVGRCKVTWKVWETQWTQHNGGNGG